MSGPEHDTRQRDNNTEETTYKNVSPKEMAIILNDLKGSNTAVLQTQGTEDGKQNLLIDYDPKNHEKMKEVFNKIDQDLAEIRERAQARGGVDATAALAQAGVGKAQKDRSVG